LTDQITGGIADAEILEILGFYLMQQENQCPQQHKNKAIPRKLVIASPSMLPPLVSNCAVANCDSVRGSKFDLMHSDPKHSQHHASSHNSRVRHKQLVTLIDGR